MPLFSMRFSVDQEFVTCTDCYEEKTLDPDGRCEDCYGKHQARIVADELVHTDNLDERMTSSEGESMRHALRLAFERGFAAGQSCEVY